MRKLRGGEHAFLLLTSHLGDPNRKPLTVAQTRELFRRSEAMHRGEVQRDMDASDLAAMGYSPGGAQHILSLLRDVGVLEWYLTQAGKMGIAPITRATEAYPVLLRKRLELDSPGCLWAKGDRSLLEKPAVALVGSRDLDAENASFAREVGRQTALQGYVLVSGNARGADQEAQRACLEAGGRVICVTADGLADKRERENLLYLSEDSYDLPFSSPRALSRNRVIHALVSKVFVAQCGYQIGGTWSGTSQNLRFGWSDVYCYRDGSPAQCLLQDMGAECIDLSQLQDFSVLPENNNSLWNERRGSNEQS